jgi:deoxyribonuclease V
MDGWAMILAVDVSYREGRAIAAGVLFRAWDDSEPRQTLFAQVAKTASYVPGQFYKRELPCILAVVQQLEQLPEYILIDGYVTLGIRRRPGLGKRLYDALESQAAVVGVAKTRFKDTPADARVYRGKSQRPLYVTAVGIDETEARRLVAGMHGEHRVPEMLRLADRLSRQGP